MALQDPVAVYNAASNVEAQLIRDLLVDAGIDAYAVEDMSPAGMYSLGVIAEIHKPQVFVDRPNVDRARTVIEEHEDHAEDEEEKPGELFCYECGEPVKQGVAHCPACGHALEWSEEAPVEGPMENLRAAKKPFAIFFLAPFVTWVCLAIAALVIGLITMLFR